jgi:hypothetical protein
MPSWNIHTAHAERLLTEYGADALGIRDVDAFLLGNLLPDVYVGYMVPDCSRKIAYKDTHFADPNFVPEPRYGEFFELYAQPDEDGLVSDLVLGSWAHLVADHDYNRHANQFFEAHGIKPCTETRIKKQGDFDLFGRTLDISLVPQVTDEVLRQCARYPQYRVDEVDVYATRRSMERIVRDNAERHVYGEPAYQMLGAEFFASTFDQVTEHIHAGLAAYAAGDSAWGAQR